MECVCPVCEIAKLLVQQHQGMATAPHGIRGAPSWGPRRLSLTTPLQSQRPAETESCSFHIPRVGWQKPRFELACWAVVCDLRFSGQWRCGGGLQWQLGGSWVAEVSFPGKRFASTWVDQNSRSARKRRGAATASQGLSSFKHERGAAEKPASGAKLTLLFSLQKLVYLGNDCRALAGRAESSVSASLCNLSQPAITKHCDYKATRPCLQALQAAHHARCSCHSATSRLRTGTTSRVPCYSL